MTDKELLELAARAADVFLTPEKLVQSLPKWEWEADWEPYHLEGGGMCGVDLWFGSTGEIGGTDSKEWNPLEDDGDAFRLAVKLNMFVDVQPCASGAQIVGVAFVSEENGNDQLAATRRAIVRTAAALAKDAP